MRGFSGEDRRAFAAAAVVALLPLAPAAADDVPTAAVGVYSELQAERGMAVYERHCSACHAANLEGAPGSPPLKGRIFMIGWRQESVGALYDYVRTLMPTGQAGTLTPQQYADVTALLLQENGFPPSADGAELPADGTALADVAIGE